MPKVLTEAQVRAFTRDGCLSPVRAMSAERARHYRERFEALEARVPDMDFARRPGEMVMFDNSLVHGSGTNFGPDRRVLLLVEMLPTWVTPPRVRQPAMLMRGVDTSGNFDDEPRPDAEWSKTALANWAAVVSSRAQLIFEDSKIGPSEAYGGTRPAT